MPKPERPVKRIIANEFPGKTYSKSVYDMPLQSEVIGVNLPTSRTTQVEYGVDPRYPAKTLVNSLVGHVNHNTASTLSTVNTPTVNFLEKSHKRIDNKINKSPHTFRDEALYHSRGARATSERIMSRLANADGEDRMILNAVSTNKKDNSGFSNYKKHIQDRVNNRRNSYAGVRSAHTYNRLD